MPVFTSDRDDTRHLNLDCLLGDPTWWRKNRAQPAVDYVGRHHWRTPDGWNVYFRANQQVGRPCPDCLVTCQPVSAMPKPGWLLEALSDTGRRGREHPDPHWVYIVGHRPSRQMLIGGGKLPNRLDTRWNELFNGGWVFCWWWAFLLLEEGPAVLRRDDWHVEIRGPYEQRGPNRFKLHEDNARDEYRSCAERWRAMGRV